MAYILITGASSGIGEIFANEYARRGNNLILVARSEDKLQAIAKRLREERNVEVIVLTKDLSKPESASEVFEFCRSNDYDIELLINNAGFGMIKDFQNQDINRIEQMLQLNICNLVKLTHLFLPQLIKRNKGGVINVASTAAFQPVPYMTAYAASKAFVLSFSIGLKEELKGSNVKVMALCPGGTDTAFFDTADYERSKLMIPLDKPEDVVKTAIERFRKGDSFVITGLANKLLIHIQRFLPRDVVTKVAGKLFK